MSPALAPLHQIPASRGWTEYTFPEDSPRQGLLTQVSFVALRAHPGRSSPTLRGAALRERILCQVVPPPPPNVDFGKLNNPTRTTRLSVSAWPCTWKIRRAPAATRSPIRWASLGKLRWRRPLPQGRERRGHRHQRRASTACTSPTWSASARRCTTTRRCRAAWSIACTATARAARPSPPIVRC